MRSHGELRGALPWIVAACVLHAACGASAGGSPDRAVAADVAADEGSPADAVQDDRDPGHADTAWEADRPDAGPDAGPSIEPPILLVEKVLSDLDPGADPRLPLDWQNPGAVIRYSGCDTVGVLFRDVLKNADGTYDTVVVVQVFAAAGQTAPPRGLLATAVKQASPLPVAGTLLFSPAADGCKVRVWRASDSRPGYDLWSLQGDGSWGSLETHMGLETSLGQVPTSLRHLGGDLDRKDQFHLLMMAGFGDGSSTPVHAWLKDQAWVVERFQFPADAEDCRFAFGTDGVLRAACRKGTDLVHGTWTDGAWVFETAATSPALADVLLVPSTIALAGYETPVIAFRRMQRTEDPDLGTAGFAWSRLELATRLTGGAWKLETLATTDDGYLGNGGSLFTGYGPDVRIDGNGGTHVAFADLAAWQEPDGTQFLDPGQVRYARRTASGFVLRTVFRQHLDPAIDPLPDLGDAPRLAVSPTGRQASFLVTERLRAPGVLPAGDGAARVRLQLVRLSR